VIDLDTHILLYVNIIDKYRLICVEMNRELFESKKKPLKCKGCGECLDKEEQ
jgi:hypothetical protein